MFNFFKKKKIEIDQPKMFKRISKPIPNWSFHSPIGKVYSFKKSKKSFWQRHKKQIIFTLLSLGTLFLSIKGFCASTITYHAPAVSIETGESVTKPLFMTCVSSSGVRESCGGGSGSGIQK